MTSPVALGEALVLLALLAIVAVRYRRALVMSLPFVAILNGLTIRLGGASMRLDQLAACALVVPLAASILIGARRLRTDSTVWWLAAIFVLNLVASGLNSPARSYSLAQCVNLGSVWIIYPLLLNFLDTPDELEAFLHRVLWAGIAGSSIGIVAYVLAVSGVPVGGAEVSASAAERLTKAYGAYGTMVEPNIFGSFTAAHLVLAVSLFIAVARHRVESTRPQLLGWVIGRSGSCSRLHERHGLRQSLALSVSPPWAFVPSENSFVCGGLRRRSARAWCWPSCCFCFLVTPARCSDSSCSTSSTSDRKRQRCGCLRMPWRSSRRSTIR